MSGQTPLTISLSLAKVLVLLVHKTSKIVHHALHHFISQIILVKWCVLQVLMQMIQLSNVFNAKIHALNVNTHLLNARNV